jgi:hypothetical protein
MDDQIWIDLGFITQLARNWADVLVGMKTDDFATDAVSFRTRVNETCDRLTTLLKEASDRADHEHCRTNHVRHPHDPDGWWCCTAGTCFHHPVKADDGDR